MTTSPTEHPLMEQQQIPICSLAVSDGGVSALRALFQKLPDDLDLAYVVNLHLSSGHQSATAETLAACTRMPVYQVETATGLRRNCVYVISPDREMVIMGNNVTARPFTEPRVERAPIDMVFRSVAKAQGDGIAVILTGPGADGVAFAQDPAEAEYPAKPQNVTARGMVSFIWPVNRLAEHITDAARSTEAVDRGTGQSRAHEPVPVGMHASALERGVPPSILVDDGQKIVHMTPGAGRFILHAGGAHGMRLADVVRPELRLDVWRALDKALTRKLPTLTLAETVGFDDGPHRVAVHVSPVADEAHHGDQALVIFLDHESALEDMRHPNEELRSIPADNRSTPKSLDPSKEELQLQNEALRTENSELKKKLESLSGAHNDLRNLISITDIGTLFLDTELCIRMFSPPIAEIFTLTEMDIGRAITDFPGRLVYDALEDDARAVLRDLVPVETEVQSRSGKWYIIRLRPYRTVEDRIEGVVLSFVNISARRHAEHNLRESQQNYQVLFDSIDEGFAIIEMIFEQDTPVNYRFARVNSAFARQTGLQAAEGKTVRDLVPEIEPHWVEIYGRVASTGKPERFEAPSDALGRYFDVYAFPFSQGGRQRVGLLFRDVSERKDAELQRQLLTDELSHRVKNTLAVVQALARQPGSGDMTVEQYRDRFVGRIRALGHAHDQLLQTHWTSADLEVLTKVALSAYGGGGRRDLDIGGPQVLLTPKQGLGLALVLHELATNASKYGSLSVEDGTLRVSWSVEQAEDGPQVDLVWRESGGPPVEAGANQGFGTRLIKQACSYELDGSVELLARPEGYVAQLKFPIG